MAILKGQKREELGKMLSDESIARLSERIDTFLYDNDPYEYRDQVGTSIEDRIKHRMQIAENLKNEDTEAIINAISEIKDWGFSSVEYQQDLQNTREAKDLVFALQHLELFEQYYDRNQMGNNGTPIREFIDDRGYTLEGEVIPVVMSANSLYSDRSIVFNAVQVFETSNNIPENERVIHDGTYEDKEFLYTAYDQYVGMSHQNDLSLQPYIDRLHDMTKVQNTDSFYPLVAEIYYAQQNGLTEEQIEHMLANMEGSPIPACTVREMRHELENALQAEEEIDV